MKKKDELKSRLKELLATFIFPEDKINDYKWLKVNISLTNSTHRDLKEVQNLIIAILKEENKDRVENNKHVFKMKGR